MISKYITDNIDRICQWFPWKVRKIVWQMVQCRERKWIFQLLPDSSQQWHERRNVVSCEKKNRPKDNFCYNNAEECSHFKYKCKLREHKAGTSTGYGRDIHVSWVTAITVYKKMVDEVRENIRLAVIGRGSYRLSPQFPFQDCCSTQSDHAGSVKYWMPILLVLHKGQISSFAWSKYRSLLFTFGSKLNLNIPCLHSNRCHPL